MPRPMLRIPSLDRSRDILGEFGIHRIDGDTIDSETGRQIADLLFSEQAERGMTLLLVTHDASLAGRCNRQIRIRSGEIIDAGE